MRIAIDDGGGLNLWVPTLSELHHIDQRFVMGCVLRCASNRAAFSRTRPLYGPVPTGSEPNG